MIAKCIPEWRFAGHFEYMESISCQNQLILDAWRRYLATKGRFYRPRLLRECIRAIFCQEAAHRLLGARFGGAPFEGCSFAVRECVSKMLRLEFFGCASERKMVIAAFRPCQWAPSMPWDSGLCIAARLQASDVAIDANGDGAGGA